MSTTNLQSNIDLIENLESLTNLDLDAILAYNHAIENIEEDEIRITLTQFRSDHERHLSDLGRLVANRGGEVLEPRRDFKGYFIENMTHIASQIGTRSSLMAMMANETLTNAKYKSALSWNLNSDEREVIERNYSDEKRHLQYIKKTLKERFSFSEPEPDSYTSEESL